MPENDDDVSCCRRRRKGKKNSIFVDPDHSFAAVCFVNEVKDHGIDETL
jgi:hypothetical protein